MALTLKSEKAPIVPSDWIIWLISMPSSTWTCQARKRTVLCGWMDPSASSSAVVWTRSLAHLQTAAGLWLVSRFRGAPCTSQHLRIVTTGTGCCIVGLGRGANCSRFRSTSRPRWLRDLQRRWAAIWLRKQARPEMPFSATKMRPFFVCASDLLRCTPQLHL